MSKTTLFATEIISNMMHNLSYLLQKLIKNPLITGDDRFVRQNMFFATFIEKSGY
jgi:hypothetical protein